MSERTVAGYYDDYVGRQRAAGVNERHHLILALALEQGLRDARHVLEIGCGIGTLTGLLSQAVPNARILAVDLSPASIAAAREQFKDRHNITWKVADVVSDHLDGTYGMIILPDVLEHIPEEHHAALFQRLRALLAPEGRVLIHAPDPYYSDWVRTHHPEQQQVIDLALHLPALVQRVHAGGLTLAHFQRHCIWTDMPDYMALTLVHAPAGHDFRQVPPRPPGTWSRVKHRLGKLFR
jgi:trans-aconitate 2-methyltransferase